MVWTIHYRVSMDELYGKFLVACMDDPAGYYLYFDYLSFMEEGREGGLESTIIYHMITE